MSNMAKKSGSIITNDEELRIVMVGKTGVGKSATGNTILCNRSFDSKFSAESLTVECAKDKAVVDGQKVFVIDTPGLFDTRYEEAKTSADLKQCIAFASPGPHVFLVVIRLGRFTEEEKQTVQKIQEIFGQSADRYSMVLFTGGDQLECDFETFLAGSKNLQELISRCHGQFHVLDNKSKDRTQVTELLQKISGIAKKNGGSHYTNEMFQEAEREIEAEKQRILKENEEKRRREREEMEREIQRKHEEEMNQLKQKIEAEKERERLEREEELKRQREEMDEERRRQMAELHEVRERERKERERENAKRLEEIRREQDRRLEEERRKFQQQKDEEARRAAERSKRGKCVIL